MTVIKKLLRSFVAAMLFTVAVGYMAQMTTRAGTAPGDALIVFAWVFAAIAFVELTGER